MIDWLLVIGYWLLVVGYETINCTLLISLLLVMKQLIVHC